MSTVCAQGLGKGYRRYARPLDRALEWVSGGPRHEVFWAVRGVSFEVRPGESFGLVGDNGAGKTTLLAMLAGSAAPTEGTLRVDGRVGSILELGSGLHSEFTGRENIFLAGQAQGLPRQRIESEVVRIIEFSELGEFIDQPVRTYSTGMFLRLAFSIATAVEPDVLVIDEALAVGDQRFQAKCLERIGAFVARGGTLIFCSHNLYQVKQLCERALWIDHGRVRELGAAAEVCDAYADHGRERMLSGKLGVSSQGSPLARVVRVEAVDGRGRPLGAVQTGGELSLRIWIRPAPDAEIDPGVAVGVVRSDGLVCHCGSTEVDGVAPRRTPSGDYYISLHFRDLALFGGSYYFNIGAIDNRRPLILLDVREGEAPFQVSNPKSDWGVSRLSHDWSHAESDEEGGRGD